MQTTEWERRVADAWASLESMANYARLLVEPDPVADPETDVRS